MESPFFTLEEAADYARFDDCEKPVVAFRKWARREHIPLIARGRKLLVEKAVLKSKLPTVDERLANHGRRLRAVAR